MHRESGNDIHAKLDDMQPAVDDIQCFALIYRRDSPCGYLIQARLCKGSCRHL